MFEVFPVPPHLRVRDTDEDTVETKLVFFNNWFELNEKGSKEYNDTK